MTDKPKRKAQEIVEHLRLCCVYGETMLSPAEIEKAADELERLDGLLNNASIDDYLESVKLETAHQVELWGESDRRHKSHEDWFWLVGYLAGKALRAAITGDREKAMHHCISTSAALANWHRAVKDNQND